MACVSMCVSVAKRILEGLTPTNFEGRMFGEANDKPDQLTPKM